VLIGDMSLIGPRPLLPQDLPEQSIERFAVRPGITSWAGVNGGRRLSPSEKMVLDTWYIRHGSFLIDVKLMFCR
jgi:undecaprenyl phosphate N,N'-diacetylbacillosamine 1-phosphate transferase